ncbi:EcsC family protein [Pseudogemmobacter humi]|uniref:EcsC protein family protein n=1 Tax=Pseudogemmobacter humi TaxID=2483812 RepID=A0A3P5XAT5_9RHOB|nr:EcsC family protein [Pseudogemmobacter humi]VDC31745.1 EcsC protein family protein [Pseudogemmobacter humi]
MRSDDPPPPLPVPPEARIAIAALALRWKKANGPVMGLLIRFGGRLENQLSALPAGFRNSIEQVTARALETSYGIARHGGRLPGSGERGTMAAAMTAGLAGGAAGLPGSIAELPFTITVLLHAIRREATKAGFDPDDPWIMAEALRTLSSGSPIAADDGIDTTFLSARIALTGPALQRLIATVAPKLAAALGQKLAAQAVPVLGAVSGAALNAAFLRYYREMAAIRFGLLRLAETHGAAAVLENFAEATRQPRITRAG